MSVQQGGMGNWMPSQNPDPEQMIESTVRLAYASLDMLTKELLKYRDYYHDGSRAEVWARLDEAREAVGEAAGALDIDVTPRG